MLWPKDDQLVAALPVLFLTVLAPSKWANEAAGKQYINWLPLPEMAKV